MLPIFSCAKTESVTFLASDLAVQIEVSRGRGLRCGVREAGSGGVPDALLRARLVRLERRLPGLRAPAGRASNRATYLFVPTESVARYEEAYSLSAARILTCARSADNVDSRRESPSIKNYDHRVKKGWYAPLLSPHSDSPVRSPRRPASGDPQVFVTLCWGTLAAYGKCCFSDVAEHLAAATPAWAAAQVQTDLISSAAVERASCSFFNMFSWCARWSVCFGR